MHNRVRRRRRKERKKKKEKKTDAQQHAGSATLHTRSLLAVGCGQL